MPRPRQSTLLPLLAGALLLLAGCAVLGPPRQATPPGLQAQSAQVHLHAAEAALRQGRPRDALRQVAGLPADLPPDLRARVLDVEARARLANGDRLGAARALLQRAALMPPAAQAPVQQQAVAILAGMGREQLSPLYAALPDDDPLKQWVGSALAQPAAGARPLPQPNQAVGALQGASAPDGYAMPARVALLVPASGPVAVAGAAVRDGFFAAYFHAADSQAPRPQIKVYDTGGTAAGALAAYAQASADGAQLVVGPLGRGAVAAIIAQASLPVPVLALNHPQSNAPTPAGSYEFALLPEAEGAQVAARMVALGLHGAIVFRGNDDTASRTFDAFRTQFESLGGQLASDNVLAADTVDFSSQIQAALGASAADAGIVLFLRPAQARLLLPQLKLARAALPVFATSIIYSGDEDATANSDLDGVQFCDEPWLYDAQAGLPDHAALASQIATAAGPAARLFAFGMDAYALAPYLRWLRANPGSYVPGATGQLTMDSSGHVQRTPIWVQFQGGIARPLAAGLESPAAGDGAATPSGP